MSEIAVVVFDWYATLAAPSPTDFWTRMPQLIAEAGGVVDQAAMDEWERGHPLAHVEISVSELVYRQFQRQRLERLLRACDIPEAALVRLVEEIEEVRYARQFALFDGVAEVLADLRTKSYRVGICSNWDWDLDRHLSFNGIADLVDFSICSATVGYRKPHPAIFDMVVAEAGVSADRVLFVGDSWSDDIGGASSAGMQVMHVSTGMNCASIDHGDVPCVSSLDGVVTQLRREARPALGDVEKLEGDLQ